MTQAQAAADPFAYEAYIEKRKQEKIEADRASRITVGSFCCTLTKWLFLQFNNFLVLKFLSCR